MAKKKQIDIGGKTLLKPISLLILFTFSNLVMFISGLTLLFSSGMVDWQTSALALVFSLVLVAEIGFSKFVKIPASLRKFKLVDWISVSVAMLLFVFSILSFFNVAIVSLNQVVGAVFMLSATTTTFNLWL